MYQTPDGWLVKVELAGVSAEDIHIDVQGNTEYTDWDALRGLMREFSEGA